MATVLTQTAIARLRPGDSIADAGCRGLRVRAFDANKSFVYRYRVGAALRQVTIGDCAHMAIGDARRAVEEMKAARKTGDDPKRIKRAAKAVVATKAQHAMFTVQDLLDLFEKDHLASRKRGADRNATLRNGLADLMDRPVDGVRRADLQKMVDDTTPRAPSLPVRIIRDWRRAFEHAQVRERIAETVADPSRGVKFSRETRYVPRSRAFTDAEWRTLLRWLPQSGMSQTHQDVLLLTALCTVRSGEAMSAKWADIDLDGATWNVRDSKGRAEHLVLLSPPAVAAFKRHVGNDPVHVFPSPTRKGRAQRQHAIVWSLCETREACPVKNWTAHDLRRSSATTMAALGVDYQVLRRMLGHYGTRSPTDIYVRAARDEEAKAAWRKLGAHLAKLAKN